MKKAILFILTVLISFQFLAANSNAEANDGKINLEMWTKEGDAEGTLAWTQELVDAFMAANPTISVELVKKVNVETLRQEFQTASLAGDIPDLLYTASDSAGPFMTAGIIQPVDKFVDLSEYVETVVMNGESWAVPMSSGNHLMLMYNKDLISTPPTNTDELIAMGMEFSNPDEDMYGLVYNQTEPFWFVPWLGGFDGKVFDEDGVTPSLDTQNMVDALQFVLDMKNKGIMPQECDAETANSLFQEGKAAMVIIGDWALGNYEELFGDKVGVTRIPMVSSTNKWPQPYTSGNYFFVPQDLPSEHEEAVTKLIKFFTSKEVQYQQVNEFNRLPGLLVAYDAPKIQENEILKGSSYQLEVGTPMPTVFEMRAVWDAMRPEFIQVLAGNTTPEDAAKAMQEAAIAGIAAQK